MTNTKQYSPITNGLPRATPRVVRIRLRVFHLVAGGILGAYPYLPNTTPGHSALRWALMIVIVPTITASGLWLWNQAIVRRWLRIRTDRRV